MTASYNTLPKNHNKLTTINKKSELMLTRCGTAYSSSSSQVILVYLYPFRCNSLFAAKNHQKITKNQYF